MFALGKPHTLMLSCYFVALIVALSVLSNGSGVAAAKKACPPNEIYFECGANCQTECATLNEPCLINHFRCPDGCYCAPGYARRADSTCIPQSQCPPK